MARNKYWKPALDNVQRPKNCAERRIGKWRTIRKRNLLLGLVLVQPQLHPRSHQHQIRQPSTTPTSNNNNNNNTRRRETQLHASVRSGTRKSQGAQRRDVRHMATRRIRLGQSSRSSRARPKPKRDSTKRLCCATRSTPPSSARTWRELLYSIVQWASIYRLQRGSMLH